MDTAVGKALFPFMHNDGKTPNSGTALYPIAINNVSHNVKGEITPHIECIKEEEKDDCAKNKSSVQNQICTTLRLPNEYKAHKQTTNNHQCGQPQSNHSTIAVLGCRRVGVGGEEGGGGGGWWEGEQGVGEV